LTLDAEDTVLEVCDVLKARLRLLIKKGHTVNYIQ